MTCHRCGHEREEHNGFAGCERQVFHGYMNGTGTPCPCRAFQEPPNPDQTTLFEEGERP